ncbi:hypothetical protein EG68_08723 [Paragonimus skrjabini miyazakii]|uniref:Protein farnesyltransferase/geranylgeranyltransferase type-1 subunit alpha n=1 Tax=Paragonimus skrjabini miyazakii TaxID=59628 RepID=A0A8S9YY59_9TREM|nr:hypothetical protein EG68_08723 [Paragonimus skrjabini miyazakii]
MKARDRYVFYKNRPEWADVTPVPQDDNGRNVIKIAYSPQFVDAHDYMRAVLLKDERSERALEITATVLLLNPANYTVWEYRRRILTSLQSDLNEEVTFVSKLIDENSKNYQLWHHRQWVVIQLANKAGDPLTSEDDKQATLSELSLNELQFTADVISDDAKNYHAWQHRRWAVGFFKVPVTVELAFTESLIREDMYNNSAWNHRFVTVTNDEGLTPSVLQREVEFVQNIIRSAPANESSWNYLYGLLVPAPCVVAASGSHRPPHSTQLSSARPDLASFNTSVDVVDEVAGDEVPPNSNLARLVTLPVSAANLRMMRTFAEELAASDTVASTSVALHAFLVEVYTDCLQAKTSKSPEAVSISDEVCNETRSVGQLCPNEPENGIAKDSDGTVTDLVDLAVSTCERLATELDRIRAGYWRYRSRQLQAIGLEHLPPS